MGTGAGCIILEREDRAIARNAKIYGYVAGLSLTSESTSLTGSDGSSASLAIKRALNQAGLSTVDFVNAHATSTRMGDEIEYDAIVKHLPDVPITANKGKIGHTMAACGAIETIYSLLSFEHNVVPKIYNLANPIITDRNLLQHNIDKNCTSFLKNSFAFGGRSASLVVTKY
jgi:3-oxoacyl-[acyl-carrier-protein] synthase II